MLTQPASPNAAESFPPEVCPACGYSLTGLPAIGVCPECGIAYDDSQLILHGWARGRHATTNNSRGLRFFIGLAPIYLVWQLFLPMPRLVRICIAVSWILPIAFSVSQRRKTDLPGRIQIRMNHAGIIQIDDVTALRKKSNLKLNPMDWFALKIDILKLQSNGRIRFRVKRLGMPWYVRIRDGFVVDAEIQMNRMTVITLSKTIELWHQKSTGDNTGMWRSAL